ncbi:hypothetical protein [Burkholderia sp. MSMB1552]|uniref:hypothetical protein n=2 Tax=unclassified Burkholderia TaxID=2613784 RepID=UPI001E2A533B|nr:hypothetical protein [Burkholderia sp. MSMB1552]
MRFSSSRERSATMVRLPAPDPDCKMKQLFLNMPNLHRTVDRAHARLVATGAAIAADCGLTSCGMVSWSNGRWGTECVELTVYRPMHGGGERYAVTRFFDGCYASVACALPEHAARALLAKTRAEFERIGAGIEPHRADDPAGAIADDPEAVSIALLSTDVYAQRRDERLEAKQLPLF